MARFDLHRRRGGRDWLLDVQHDALAHLPTRLVVPVLPAHDAPPPLGALTPQFEIEGELHTVFPHYMAAVETQLLGRRLATPAAHQDRILRALHLLQHGF